MSLLKFPEKFKKQFSKQTKIEIKKNRSVKCEDVQSSARNLH